MISDAALLLLAIVGVLGCLAVFLVAWWGAFQWEKQILEGLREPKRTKAMWIISRPWLQHAYAAVFSTMICALSYLSMVQPVLDYTSTENACLYLIVAPTAILTVVFCIIEHCIFSQDHYQRIARLYTAGFLLFALIFAFSVCVSLAFYGIATRYGENDAADRSLHYHGPARIIGYQATQSASDDDTATSANITIAYGGSWACPSYPDVECQVEIALSNCDYYDGAGDWTTERQPLLQQRYWRYWKGTDHWQDSFSCASGFFGADDNDDDGAYIFGDDVFDSNTAPDDNWPYLVHIFASCQNPCQLALDSEFFRSAFYRFEQLKTNMLYSGLASLLFLSMVAGMWKFTRNYGTPPQASNEVELIQNEGGVAA